MQKIREIFAKSPRNSPRRLSVEEYIPLTSVHRIDHEDLSLYPYKLQILQQQPLDNRRQRVELCAQLSEKIENSPDFLNSIHFGDESHFQLSGHVNNQSYIFWENQQPFATTEAPLTTKKVTVWCGI